MKFNIRVYGILIDEERGILISDEKIRGSRYLKFPGGGLEFGEGTRDCLKREFMEELNLKIEVLDHLYTTDFYQKSAFGLDDQIISIYYYVKALEPVNVDVVHKDEINTPFEQYPHADQESFRFIPFKKFSEEIFDLPIDKIVAGMIRLPEGS